MRRCWSPPGWGMWPSAPSWAASCWHNDNFAVDRMLPKIDMGDLLVIHDTGAHGHAMGYQYNGRLRSAEVLLCQDGSTRLIRRAETPEDYFSTAVWE